MTLVIGNKRSSSWSLRPWLLLKHFGIEFEEKLIPLDQPQSKSEILRHSPSGKLPTLIDGSLTIWESLAIAEYLNEKFPEKSMWPRDPQGRAIARAVANEMHGGFQNLRTRMPHDLNSHYPGFDWQPARVDINRVQDIWRQCLTRSGGPFLFGPFSIADAMYAPVVNRFVTYDVPVGDLQTYVHQVRELPAHVEWIQEAKAETFTMPAYTRHD